jgi:hypothetical protein
MAAEGNLTYSDFAIVGFEEAKITISTVLMMISESTEYRKKLFQSSLLD